MKSKITIEVLGIDFSAAHFVSEGGKCERLHGHNYHVSAKLSGTLDKQGMIADFRKVKILLRNLCKKWDHRILIPTQSSLITSQTSGETIRVDVPGASYTFPTRDVVHLDVIETTAEELARLLCEDLTKAIKAEHPNVHLVSVTVAESETSRATVDLAL
jgi:6-pyruvoyltetrahydropterin/6-carboxytetrahydropterin synthase